MRNKEKPDLERFRRALFGDTDIDKIDWDKQFISVIHRVYERGNEEEKREITRFYGQSKIDQVLGINPIS